MSAKKRIRLISYNIQKGAFLPKLKRELKRLELDLAFLQEVRGAPLAQAEELADQVWSHYAYGKNAIYDAGNHGNAILSKYPFVSWENMDLSTNRLESRGLIHGVVTVGRRELHVLCTHLNLLSRSRKVQLKKIVRRIRESVPQDAPLILAGDFNDWSEVLTREITGGLGCVEVFQRLHEDHAGTFPVWFPVLKLDRIYCRGLEPTRADILLGKPWTRLSDHAPILAELEFV